MIDPMLSAVLEKPGDLASRLAYADARVTAGDPLGEFIRRDCQLGRSLAVDDPTLEAWDRQFALLEAYRDSWDSPLSEKPNAAGIRRGLVEHVRLGLDDYLQLGPELFARFPVRSLSLDGVPGRMSELLASPYLDRIEYLSLSARDRRGDGDLTDDDVVALAASDRLHGLRGVDLGFNGKLGPASVEAILNAPWRNQLGVLDLSFTAVSDEGAALIASSGALPSLQGLDLSNAELGPIGARALADSTTLARLGLRELDFSLNQFDSESNAHLLRSPVLARVGKVHLEGGINNELVDAFEKSDSLGAMKTLDFGNAWTVDAASLRRLAQWTGLAQLESMMFVLSGFNDEHFDVLSSSPWLGGLKSLILSETRVTEEGVERFCQSPAWQGLRDLDIDRHRLTERSVRSILAANWFPQLLSLDLHASYTIGDEGAAVLATYQGPTRLRRLSLSMGKIGDAGALAFADARYAPQLWSLWLAGNDISPPTCDLLRQHFGGRVFSDSTRRGDWRIRFGPLSYKAWDEVE